MQKKNQLKEYAFKLYNEHKDDKNLRVVKNIIWEALEELIDNYGQFMTEENIKKAVEELFNVKVDSVNVLVCDGKERRRGYTHGTTPSFKKAVVTLTKDSKTIEFFDSLM